MADLLKNPPAFEWVVHSNEFVQLKSYYDTELEKKLQQDLDAAEVEVREFCASLYQVQDPYAPLTQMERYRRSTLVRPRLALPVGLLPEGSGRAELQGRYRRIMAWQAAADLTQPAHRQALAQELQKQLEWLRSRPEASNTASRCKFESELLAWDPNRVGSPWLDIPDEPEALRWQAHAQFKDDVFWAKDTLKHLADYYRVTAIAPDPFDLSLGSAAAVICWDKYRTDVRTTLKLNDKGYYSTRSKLTEAQDLKRKELARPAKEVLDNLRFLLTRARPETIQNLADDLAGRTDNPRVQLLIQFLQGQGGSDEIGRIFRGLELEPDPETAAQWEEIQLLLQ
jgi:hypothetical protein